MYIPKNSLTSLAGLRLGAPAHTSTDSAPRSLSHGLDGRSVQQLDFAARDFGQDVENFVGSPAGTATIDAVIDGLSDIFIRSDAEFHRRDFGQDVENFVGSPAGTATIDAVIDGLSDIFIRTGAEFNRRDFGQDVENFVGSPAGTATIDAVIDGLSDIFIRAYEEAGAAQDLASRKRGSMDDLD